MRGHKAYFLIKIMMDIHVNLYKFDGIDMSNTLDLKQIQY